MRWLKTRRLDSICSIRMTMKLLTAAAATLLSTASYSSRSSARAFSSASNHLLNPSRSLNRDDHRLSVIANTRGGGTLITSPHQPFSSTPFSRKIVRAFNRPTPTEVESDVATVVDAYELVKESASKMTAGEKLDMMRRKMEECGVDGKNVYNTLSYHVCCDITSLPDTTYLFMITLSYRVPCSPPTQQHKY